MRRGLQSPLLPWLIIVVIAIVIAKFIVLLSNFIHLR